MHMVLYVCMHIMHMVLYVCMYIMHMVLYVSYAYVHYTHGTVCTYHVGAEWAYAHM